MSTRYIDIESTDVRVGYYFPTNNFYVTTFKSTPYKTSTYRTSEYEIKAVLEAININVPLEDIQALKSNVEVLESISYTWNSTGSYIHSIQFNEWHDHAIIMDCEKQKLYIDNSTLIFDLATNESPELVRVPLLMSYYEKTLGLQIEKPYMLAVYRILISYYNPELIQTDRNNFKQFYLSHKCTNQITSRTSEDTENNIPLTYNNTFSISDYSKNTPIVYTCSQDPYNNPVPTTIGNISSLSEDTIITKEPITTDTKEVVIQGCNIELDGEVYSADGTYTVQNIQDNVVTVTETLPITYIFPYYKLFALNTPYTISSVSRETNSITINQTPNNIIVGDIVVITGANIPQEFETIQIDGRYTVSSISGNTVTVAETIPTNHTYTSGAKLTKEVYIGDIQEVNNTVITLLEPTIYGNNLENKDVSVYNNSMDFNTREVYTVQSPVIVEEGLTSTLTLDRPIQDFPVYPELQYPKPNEEMLLNMEYSKYQDIMPTGEFMVDNFEEVRSYLSLATVKGTVIATLPTDNTEAWEQDPLCKNPSIKDNLYSKVPETMTIPIEIRGAGGSNEDVSFIMTCVGIYDEVYKNESEVQ